jgi:Tfp pilus assembly protein PilF
MLMSDDKARALMLFKKGTSLMSADDPRDAEAHLREAICIDPDFAEAHANLGLLLDQEGRTAEAETSYRNAVAINHGLGKAHMYLGLMLARKKRFEEAETAFGHAHHLLAHQPDYWVNRGVMQTCRKQEEEAEKSYCRALELDPDYRSARFNLAYLFLRQGRLEEGWKHLESRNWYERLEKGIPFPRWQGEPLEGKSLLIGFEAGHGDMIQFCRYAGVLKSQGAARIALVCHPGLERLFATMTGVDEVLSHTGKGESGEFHFWTPPLSLPYHCRTRLDSIPACLPYLRPDEGLVQKWAGVLSQKCTPNRLRVGLVWKGNPRFENDADRSLPCLKVLEPWGSISGVQFIGLQKGAGEEEGAQPPAGLPLVNLGPLLSDFADMAAVMASLDLVISVDTAAAHLAGALARKCWVLLPDFMTDWRWMAGRTDSPWYPGVMKLFRQQPMGDWSSVIAEVGENLKELALSSFPGE